MTVEHQGRVTMSVTEAARAAGVDRRTIRRRLEGGEFPNAHRDSGRHGQESGPWRIPVGDLLQAGIHLSDPADINEAARSRPHPSEAEELRKALADAVLRAEVAEARAAERERVIEAQELALRSLVAGVQADDLDEVHHIGSVTDTRPSPEGRPTRSVTTTDRSVTPDAAALGASSQLEPPHRSSAEPSAAVPPVARPYPEEAKRPTPTFLPGAPLRPTPPWVPIPPPPPRRRWWQRRP